MTALVVALGVVVALLAVLVVGLLRSHAEILRRLHELGAGVYDDAGTAPAGAGATSAVALSDPPFRTRPGVAEPRPGATPARDLVGTTPDGAARSVTVVGAPHATLLAFLSSGCATCLSFWEAFAGGEADRLPGRDTRLVVVTKGPEAESPAAVAALAPAGTTTLMSSDAFTGYGVAVSPYFILVDGPSGQVVGEGAAGSWAQVAALLAQAAADAGLGIDGPSHDRAADEVVAARQRGARQREARADADLAAAGIGPGHPSLYPGATATPAATPSPEPGPEAVRARQVGQAGGGDGGGSADGTGEGAS